MKKESRKQQSLNNFQYQWLYGSRWRSADRKYTQTVRGRVRDDHQVTRASWECEELWACNECVHNSTRIYTHHHPINICDQHKVKLTWSASQLRRINLQQGFAPRFNRLNRLKSFRVQSRAISRGLWQEGYQRDEPQSWCTSNTEKNSAESRTKRIQTAL